MDDELIIDGQAVPLSEAQEKPETTAETEGAQQHQAEEKTQENSAQKESDGAESGEQGEGDEPITELALTVGDEEIPLSTEEDLIDGKPAPAWVTELRQKQQQQEQENAELRRQLEEKQNTQAAQPTVTETIPLKPTLESCDYDEAAYETKLSEWHDARTRSEQAKQQQQQQQQAFQQQFQARLKAHQERAAKLPVKDYDAAEQVVRSQMPDMHKEVLIHTADEGSELIAYALGKNQQLRQQIAAEQDPLRVAYKLGQLSVKAKLAPKVNKQAAKPEPEVRGGAANANSDEFNKLCPGAVIE